MSRRNVLALRIVAGVLVAVALYAAFGFLIAPRILESRLKALANERLGQPLAIEHLKVNPFAFSAQASGVRLGSDLVSADRLTLDFGLFSSGFGRGWVLDELRADAPKVEVDLLQNGRLNLSALADRWRSTAGPAKPGEPPPRITVRHLLVNDGAVTFRDFQSSMKPASQALPVRVELFDFTTLPDREGRYSVQAQFVGGGSLDWKGDFALVPLRSEGDVALRALPLATPWKLASDRLGIAEPAGTLDLGGHYRFSYADGKPQLALDRLQLAAARVAIAAPGAKRPWLRAGRLEAKQGKFDLATRRVSLPAVQVDDAHFEDRSRAKPVAIDLGSLGGSASLELAQAGVRAQDVDLRARKISLAPSGGGHTIAVAELEISRAHVDTGKRVAGIERLAVRGGTLPVNRKRDGSIDIVTMFQPAKQGAPWHFEAGDVSVENIDVPFSDASFGQPIAYELGGVSAHASNIGNGKPTALDASARLGGGSVRFKGSAASGFEDAQGRLQLSGVDLAPLQPLVANYASVTFSARASADAKLDYRRSAKPALRASGALALDRLAINEPGRGQVLAAQRVSANNVRFSASPQRLAIREVIMQSPQARIAISREHHLNLAQLVKRPPSEHESSGSFAMGIGSLRVRDGTVDYSDASLVLPFSTRVTSFQGAFSGLTSDPARRAQLEFQGEVGDSGSVHVKGAVDAAKPTQFTDIAVSFENVRMPPLTPYSATFLGRRIDAGDLWLDLDYKIADGKLAGQNRITARNLKLGEHVNSPGALDVPLDLVLALLTDSQGRIAADVPVSGDLGNPDFEIGPALRSAFAGLVRRIVSAPFRALAGVLGKKNEQLEAVGFDPGSAALPPSERDKLREVANVLRDRPQLRLVVHPAYDPDRDGLALREDRARRDLDRALGRTAQEGEPAGPVAFDSPGVQRAIERLLGDRDPKALDQVAADFTHRTGHEPRRVSLLGALFGAKGDPDFYRAAFDRLVKSEPLPEDAGQELAREREQAIREFLQQAGIDASRVQAGGTEPGAQAQNRINARLSLQA